MSEERKRKKKKGKDDESILENEISFQRETQSVYSWKM